MTRIPRPILTDDDVKHRADDALKQRVALNREAHRAWLNTWVNDTGESTPLQGVPNETLCAHVCRLVDARRRQMDDELLTLVQSDEFETKHIRRSMKELTFGPRMKALLSECERRGISIDKTR